MTRTWNGPPDERSSVPAKISVLLPFVYRISLNRSSDPLSPYRIAYPFTSPSKSSVSEIKKISLKFDPDGEKLRSTKNSQAPYVVVDSVLSWVVPSSDKFNLRRLFPLSSSVVKSPTSPVHSGFWVRSSSSKLSSNTVCWAEAFAPTSSKNKIENSTLRNVASRIRAIKIAT